MASTLSNDVYDLGDRVRLSVEVRDAENGDALIDPDTLEFTMKEPDAALTTYTYGVDSEVVKDGTGLYHVNWTAAQVGLHWSRYVTTGNVGAAEERGFRVRPSKVL